MGNQCILNIIFFQKSICAITKTAHSIIFAVLFERFGHKQGTLVYMYYNSVYCGMLSSRALRLCSSKSICGPSTHCHTSVLRLSSLNLMQSGVLRLYVAATMLYMLFAGNSPALWNSCKFTGCKTYTHHYGQCTLDTSSAERTGEDKIHRRLPRCRLSPAWKYNMLCVEYIIVPESMLRHWCSSFISGSFCSDSIH